MDIKADCAKATEVCGNIKNDGARFFWLKLGESLAVGGKIPRLVPDGEQDESGEESA